MPDPDVDNVALREACAASLYGFDTRLRRDDAFDESLAAICDWAVTIDGYDAASIDVFTGDAFLTVSGRPQPRATLEEIYGVVSGDPARAFHSRATWAGATLLTPHGVVLGSLDLWADAPVTPGALTRARLPLLARAVMHVLDERQRIVSRRAVPTPGPRAMTARPTSYSTPLGISGTEV